MANIITKKLDFSRFKLGEQSTNLIRFIPTNESTKSASPRLLNWVEPVIISGYTKSIFYTDIDSNLKKGDRVFIVNGNYDSDALIDIDKYKKGRDGYKILDIDRCKITLDIDYTGELPWIEEDIDSFIKIFHVRNQREFDYINSQFICRDVYANKFEIYQNNFIYVDSAFTATLSGLNQNNGVSGPGFWYRVGTTWNSITTDLLTNSPFFQSILSTNFQNNGRIKIMNSKFTSSGKEWRESNIYKFDTNLNEWIVDAKYMRPFITKSNFRRGNFKGDWNKGIYGSYDEKIKWMGDESNWSNGVTINTEWVKGSINSNHIPSTSYFAEFDEFGIPVQKVNTTNNRGFGYNYFIDMDITSSIINNGNYIGCNIGTTATFSAVEGYYQNWNSLMQNVVNLGEFTSCNFESSFIRNSVFKSSRISNSHVESSKSINSYFDDSVFYKSNYESDNIIKIQDYDEWCVNINPFSSSDGYKVYKFYINESDIERVKSLDKFSIKGLKLSIDDYYSLNYDGILNFFDRAFILDSYKDTDDYTPSALDGSTQVYRDIICKVSTAAENTFKLSSYYSGGSYSTAATSSNDKLMASIDIILRVDSAFGNHDYNTSFPTSPTSSVSLNNVDISAAYIIDSYYDSGLFEQSNWNSGSLYNYNLDNRILGLFEYGQLSLSFTNSQIYLQVPDNGTKGIKDNYFNINDIVYLNGVDYNNGYTITRLPSIYKISNQLPGSPGHLTLVLDEYLVGTTTSVISSLTSSGIFLTSPDGLTSSTVGTNRYNFLHKTAINNSVIKTGIIRRGYINKSRIEYDKFNNSDYKFDDKVKSKELMVINSLFTNNQNTIKSGLITESYIKGGSDNWLNGILWKSIWENGTFNNGVVRDSNWINGTFKNGMFYNSKTSFFLNRKKAYYKSGNIQITSSNNIRNVWENGIFENGDFFESIWENGTFKNGRFYKSSWSGGLFENGVFGNIKFNNTDNNFYAGTFSNGVVVNSNFYSGFTDIDPIIAPVSYPSTFNGIQWLNGVFQSGIFRNDVTNPSASAIWYDGTFNGGDFTNTSIWLNGTFNDGKFTSYYGCTAVISNTQSDYGWRDGKFNGGEFGTKDGLTNSTWWTGEMYGGIFRGKVWNNGILISGEFQGGATVSCVGGVSASNASTFVDGFSYSYYGLWRDGYVTDVKDKFIKHKEIFTNVIRFTDEPKFSERVNRSKAVIKDALWMTGTFSHRNGETNNVVWLDGTFDYGKFKNSSFNPYVKRNGSTQSSFNLNDDTCVWKDGNFDGGDFFISVWEKGNFIIGTAYGMLWQNGVTNYMNAFNVCWEDGLWRNGNWYGSSFTFDGYVNDDFTKQILFRLMNDCTGTASCHIWNVFEDTSEEEISFANATASTIIGTPLDIDFGEPEVPFLPEA